MAKVITNVGTIVPITPATESQTRALMEIRGLYQDRVMDALRRFEKSRKTGTGRKGKS